METIGKNNINFFNISTIKKLYIDLDNINNNWSSELDNALKLYHNELETLGYKKENDYTPNFEDSDEEWSKYDKIETLLNEKYDIGRINKKYSSEQNKIVNEIWNILKNSIEILPDLEQYKDVLCDKKYRFRIVNKFKDILKKI